MRIWTNAIVAGGLLAAAVILKKLVRSRRSAEVATPTDELTFSAPPERDAGSTAVAELKKDLLVFASERPFA